MKGILSRLVHEAADQKHLATVIIFLVMVARELVQQMWSGWFELEPAVGALVGSLITPAILSLLVYVVLSAYEAQEQRVREQEERLQEAERARLALETVLQMSATVQHEINNPLMVIGGNVDLSLQQDPENPRLKKIKEAVQRIREVTRLLSQIKRVQVMVDARQRAMIDLEASVKASVGAGLIREEKDRHRAEYAKTPYNGTDFAVCKTKE